MVTAFRGSAANDQREAADPRFQSTTTGILAKLELRVRHLEAIADYVQGLERRNEALEREVHVLHARIDKLEDTQPKSSSSNQTMTRTPHAGSCSS